MKTNIYVLTKTNECGEVESQSLHETKNAAAEEMLHQYNQSKQEFVGNQMYSDRCEDDKAELIPCGMNFFYKWRVKEIELPNGFGKVHTFADETLGWTNSAID